MRSAAGLKNNDNDVAEVLKNNDITSNSVPDPVIRKGLNGPISFSSYSHNGPISFSYVVGADRQSSFFYEQRPAA